MIGIKTIGVGLFVALALAIAGAGGVLGADHLGGLTAASCLVIGLFAGLATALVDLGWRPAEPSRLGLPERGADAAPWDAPPLAQRALFTLVFVCVGLVAFGNRETALLVAAPAELTAAGSEYCAEPGDEPVAAPPKAPEPAVDVRGCALIKRAYELGYAKSLGACAPKPVEETTEAERLAVPVCEKRQRDEPFWHWTWRQWDRNTGDLAGADPIGAIGEQVDEFQVRLDYVDTAIAQQRHAIDADPRASHHIWINLPAPDEPGLLARLLAPESCDIRYRDPPVHPEAGTPAAAIEHAFARLLFDPSLGQPVGFCGDYVLHWGAPDDACERLVADPEGFLDDAGALDRVRAVLDRRQRRLEQRQLAADLGRAPRIAEPPPARGVVSFQCFAVGDTAARPVQHAIRVDGTELFVRAMAGPIDSPVAPYVGLARLLAGVVYAGAAGEVSIAGPTAPLAPRDLEARELRLLSLEHLRDADPFLGHTWPLDDADLAAVYPMHLHLSHFAEVFRNGYRRERGRL